LLTEDAAATSAARMCFMRWGAYLCGDRTSTMPVLDELVTTLTPLLEDVGPIADELYEQAMRLLMFVSETAISRQDETLYPHIETINDLIARYLRSRGDNLAVAFRTSYLAWVADAL